MYFITKVYFLVTVHIFCLKQVILQKTTTIYKYSYFGFPQKILQLKHRKKECRLHELFSNYRKMGFD